MNEDPKPKRRSVWKWVGGILLGLLLLGSIGGYFVKQYLQGRWKPLLDEQLKKLVVNSTDSLYRIEYSDFDLNMASGNVVVSDFKLIPDTGVYNKLLAAKKAPDNLYDLSVKKLQLRKLMAKEAITDKKLSIGSIIIDNPSLTITNRRQPYNDTVKVGKPKTPYQLISKVFKTLRIDSIVLKDIDFAYVNRSNPKVKKTALRNLSISINDIFIDSLSAKDTSRFYYTKNVQLRLKNYKLATPDSLYFVKTDELFFSTSERRIQLNEVAFTPRLNKNRFYKKVGYAKDRFDISFKQIDLMRIDLQKFLREQKVQAGYVNLGKGKLEVFNNNAYPNHKTVKVHAYPHQKLQQVALDLRVDTLSLSDVDISYSEFNASSGQTGTISFDHTSGKIYNVTNDSAWKKSHPFMLAKINTRFMNSSALNVNFKFDLNDKNGAFNYSGVLSRTNGKVLNKVTRPLGMIEVESADIKKLAFHVSANETTATGNLQFYYDDLKVSLMKKDGSKLEKQGFVSSVANMVLPTANPGKDGKFLPGPINYRREPTASFFNFLWKALFDGLKPSVGFTDEKEQKLNNTVKKVEEVKTGFNETKSLLKQALEERRKRRAEKKRQKEQQKEK